MPITKLDIEKAVDDAIQRAASDDKRKIEMGGAISSDELRGSVTAEVGRGWSLSAIYRRFRRTKQNEVGFGVTKDF